MLKLIRQVYSPDRERFLLTEDTYGAWVILTAETGSFAYVLGDGEPKETASFGDLILCPPGVRLARQVTEWLAFHFIEFEWHGPAPIPSGKIAIRDVARLSSTLRYLRETADAPGMADWRAHWTADLLALASLEHTRLTDGDESRSALARRAAALMEQHACHSATTVSGIAAHLHVSPAHLTRAFRSCFGISPIAYMSDIRLREAKRLLAETSYTLDEIAERCGYANGFYLSRVFSRMTDSSPSAYRRSMKI